MVLGLRKGLRGVREMYLPYRQLGTFFILGSNRLTTRPSALKDNDMLITIVHALLKDITLVDTQMSEPTSPDLPPSTWATIIKALITRMEGLVDQNNRRTAAIKSASGPCVVGESLDVIATRFARQPDADALRMFVSHVGIYIEAEHICKDEDLAKQLEELVGVLKTLVSSSPKPPVT